MEEAGLVGDQSDQRKVVCFPRKWDGRVSRRRLECEGQERDRKYKVYRADTKSKTWVLTDFESKRKIIVAPTSRKEFKSDPVFFCRNCWSDVVGFNSNLEKLWQFKYPVKIKNYRDYFGRFIEVYVLPVRVCCINTDCTPCADIRPWMRRQTCAPTRPSM